MACVPHLELTFPIWYVYTHALFIILIMVATTIAFYYVLVAKTPHSKWGTKENIMSEFNEVKDNLTKKKIFSHWEQ